MLQIRPLPKYFAALLLAAACDSSDANGGASDAAADAAPTEESVAIGTVGPSDPVDAGANQSVDGAADAAAGSASDAGDGAAPLGDAAPNSDPTIGVSSDAALVTSDEQTSTAHAIDGGVGLTDGGAVGTLFEDDFDGETLDNGEYTFKYTAFEHWTVIGGTVDIIALPNQLLDSPGGYGPGEAADGVTVDLNGSSLSPGVIESKREFTFYAGATYELSYALGSPFEEENGVRVEIDGVFSAEESQLGILPFAGYAATFTPETTTTAKLRFTSLGDNDNVGLFLDEVVLERLP